MTGSNIPMVSYDLVSVSDHIVSMDLTTSLQKIGTVKLPTQNHLDTINRVENPEFFGPVIKCPTLLYVTFRKIPKFCWSERL